MKLISVTCVIITLTINGFARNGDILIQRTPKIDSSIVLPGEYFSQVTKKMDHVSSSIDKETDKELSRLIRREQAMQRKLNKVDSSAAKRIFNHSIDSLNALKNGLRKNLPANLSLNDGATSAYLDTLGNSLKFLKGSNNLLGASNSKLKDASKSLASMESSVAQAAQIKTYIQSHKEELNAKLKKYTIFSNDLSNLNKEVYYYNQKVNDYKEALKDKKKAEEKALMLLKQLPAYNKFIQQNSMFASLFNSAQNASALENLEGFQTRSIVEDQIQQRMGGNSASQQAVSQQMDQAKSQLEELKNKLPSGGSTADMPNFKPNEMKNKSFLQRLEFGGNIQFQKSTQYFPTTANLAGQISYKFNKNGNIGLGVAYKLGMGTGWDHIAFTHQGVGLRSFIDWKIKGSFYINAGFEENYNTVINRVDNLKNWKGWESSALAGLSKKFKINAKINGSIILLYDFLAKLNVPAEDPFKVRIGYTF